MKIKKQIRKLAAMIPVVLAVTLLAGCGNKKADTDTADTPEYIYVPEYYEMSVDEDSYIGSAFADGDQVFYYTERWNEESQENETAIYRYDFQTKKEEKLPIELGEDVSFSGMQMTPDGRIAMLLCEWTYNEDANGEFTDSTSNYSFWFADPESGEITEKAELTEDAGIEKSAYLGSFTIDGQGNYYFFNSGSDNEYSICVVSAQLKPLADITLNGYINQVFPSKEGDVYVICYGDTGMEIRKVDLTKKALGDPLKLDKDFTNMNSCVPGMSAGFLVNDQDTVYAVDVETQTVTEVLDWLDSDINGSNVNYFGELADGRIWALSSDYNGETSELELVVLNRKKSSEVAQKEEMTIGTIWLDDNVKRAVIDFNKTSEQYHISVKNYGQDDWSAGLTQFNADIVSGAGPDLVDFSDLNYSMYAEKGVFEDLYPYMEKSGIKKEDYLENILEAYETDGKLYGITTRFNLNTIVGKKSMVGDISGWTLSEMMDFIEQHKESEAFSYASQQSMLYYLIYMNMDEFIDWETGTCSFNGPEFARILNYVKTLPEEVNYNEEDEGEATKIRSNKLLMISGSISSVTECQMLDGLMEEEAVFVGYPDVDRQGNLITSTGGSFAISSKSKHKDAAWAFLQTLMSEDYQKKLVDDWGYAGFPILKSALDYQFEKDMTPEYYTDENGEQVEQPKTSWSYGNDFEMEIYAAKQEDIDTVRGLISSAKKRQNSANDELINIITEETEPFFKGQKSAEDAANVIQNRIQVYVNENR